ncbi:hypothetical protein KY289_036775 [Solanum tuberosum]|nr:hypothetical protein KY289_036775 [Solanum tuberosum]
MKDNRGEDCASGREESGKVPGIADSVGEQSEETVSFVCRMVSALVRIIEGGKSVQGIGEII